MRYCFQCGTKNDSSARLCRTCGSTLRRPQTPSSDLAADRAKAGKQRPASTGTQGTPGSNTVIVPRGPVRLPLLCVRCLCTDAEVLIGHSGDEHLVERHGPYRVFECLTQQMPYCRTCATWVQRKRRLGLALGLGIAAAGLVASIAYGWSRGVLILWALGGGLVWQAIDWFGEPVRMRRWSSTEMSFWFASARYAELFALANSVRGKPPNQ